MSAPREVTPRVRTGLGAGAVLALLLAAGVAAAARKGPVAGPAPRTGAVADSAARASAAPGSVTRADSAAAVADSSRRAWTEARGLADAGRHEEALLVLEPALRRDPANADLRWLNAAVTGWAGRHAEAVAQYERLLADRPDLARELRPDLANEKLAAGDVTGAIWELDVRLAAEPGDREARKTRALALSQANRLEESLAAYDALLAEQPDDADVMMERARVLAWMGRNADAAEAYRAVLARDPVNRKAKLGLAMNENWQGLHQRAAQQLQALADEPQPDPEAIKALAFARYWSGDPDRARVAADRFLALHPDDPEALDLSRRLAQESRPGLTAGYARADDSDGLRVESPSLEYRTPLPRRNTLMLGMQRDHVRDNAGTEDPFHLRAGVETAWSAAVTTRASLDHVEFGDDAGSTGLFGMSVTWRPADRWRLDGGVSNDLVVTRVSLALGITTRTWVGGADWNATERLTARAAVRQRFYSDDNRSQNEVLSAAWQAWTGRRGSVVATLGGEQLRTRLNLDNGYYDPEQYLEWGPGVEAGWTPRPDLALSGVGKFGWQRERGAPTEPFFNLSGRAEWTVSPAFTLSLEGGLSNSNLSSASGYERRFWTVSGNRGF